MKLFKKKNKENPADLQEKKEEAKPAMENIEFHNMPDKFKGGVVHSSDKTKKMGILIMVGGAIIIITVSVFLFKYLFNSTPSEPKVANQDKDKTSQEMQAKTQAEEEKKEVEEEEDNRQEKNCGVVVNVTADNFDNLSNNDALQCLGERVEDGCRMARIKLMTPDFGDINIKISQLDDDRCLVETSYLMTSFIQAEGFENYSGTLMRCENSLDDLTSLQYNPAKLAHYVYTQNSLLNIENNLSCTGSAIALWQDQQQEANLPELEEEEEEIKINFIAGVDSDNDGLTDLEENYVFVTDINSTDTDQDGYIDGSEVLNLYNPAGNGNLADSALVKQHNNTVNNYSILYPIAWRMEGNSNSETVQFLSDVDGFVQIITQTNNDNLSLSQWYANLSDNTSQIQQTKNGLNVIYSADGLTAYITPTTNNSKVYVINYSPGENKKLEFINTFKMMIASLEIK